MRFLWFMVVFVALSAAAEVKMPNVTTRAWGSIANVTDSVKQVMQQRLFRLKYITAKDAAAQMQNSKNIFVKKGNYTIDERNNLLLLRGSAKQLQQTQKWLQTIDRPSQQVLIHAKIVYIDDNCLQRLGLSVLMQQSDSSKQQFETARLPLVKLSDLHALSAEIDALSETGHAEVIASPQLLTTNLHAAAIASGEEIPYQQSAGNGVTSSTFKKALMRLQVLPRVLFNKDMLLAIDLNQDQVSHTLINGLPIINTRELKTQVELHDNQTVVLGGIKQYRQQRSRHGIPFLSRIPVLGYLFGRRVNERQKQSLLIIITPRIVK